jgi:hypothetical protein
MRTRSPPLDRSHAEVWIVPGSGHGYDILLRAPDVTERVVAVWLSAKLLPKEPFPGLRKRLDLMLNF